MHRVALILMLLWGSNAMARDTNFKPAPDVAREQTPLEQFMQTERGQDMQHLLDLMKGGDEDGFQRAHESYRKKYNAPPLGGWPEGAQGPASRSTGGDLANPRLLPPEAR